MKTIQSLHKDAIMRQRSNDDSIYTQTAFISLIWEYLTAWMVFHYLDW